MKNEVEGGKKEGSGDLLAPSWLPPSEAWAGRRYKPLCKTSAPGEQLLPYRSSSPDSRSLSLPPPPPGLGMVMW